MNIDIYLPSTTANPELNSKGKGKSVQIGQPEQKPIRYVTLDIVFLLVSITYDKGNIPSLIRGTDSDKGYHVNAETDTFF